jgi:hypothetical protein
MRRGGPGDEDRTMEDRGEEVYALRSLPRAPGRFGVDRGGDGSRAWQVSSMLPLVRLEGAGGDRQGREVGRPERTLHRLRTSQ